MHRGNGPGATGLLCLAALPILSEPPAKADPAATYLFHLHGRIVQEQGREAVSPKYGRYEYDAILARLAEAGLVILSEVLGRCPNGSGRSSDGPASAPPERSALEGRMPFSLQLEPGSGVVVGTCTGPLNAADARKGALAFWEKPEWNGRPVVWDFREAQFDIHAPEIRDVAQFILDNQPPSPPPRVAFVTIRDVDFGLARIFEVYREHPATTFRVFRDFDEAMAWAMRHGSIEMERA